MVLNFNVHMYSRRTVRHRALALNLFDGIKVYGTKYLLSKVAIGPERYAIACPVFRTSETSGKQWDWICLFSEASRSVCQMSRGPEFQRAMVKALPQRPPPPPSHTSHYLFLMMEVRRLPPPPPRAEAVSRGSGDDGDQSGMRVQDCAELCGVMKRSLPSG